MPTIPTRTTRFTHTPSVARVASLVLGAACLIGVSVPVTPASACAVASQVAGPVPAPVRRTVQINGRTVIVELSVLQVVGGAPREGMTPTTTAHVTLSVNDGAMLPAGLKATSVRFEKQRGINPQFSTRLVAVQSGDPGQFERVQALYQGDLPDHLAAQRLRSTVVLDIGGRTVRVQMGTVPVTVVLLP